MSQTKQIHALWVAVSCIGALTACGESSQESGAPGATTLSSAEYVQRADEVCGRVATEALQLNAEGRLRTILNDASAAEEDKMEEAADVLEEQRELLSGLRSDMQALGVPETGREDVQAFLAKSDEAEAALGDAIDSLRAGDQTAATEALQAYASLSQESAELAQASELDFQVCGTGA